ncbi:MAG: secondary thiamine-phosphate synthase enzyme YjbQ [Candidatus Bipolaricaulota bacterium]|nr:secondary thiamine-phosphate synthase enzyme YjbQ [Candidatus Bipolaricaulota bacterium]MDW8126487.1 secondary thiamine-phosphate synthase enzyme YjbQ [Candidatus Bipolaricaulota bacterium]
MSLKRKEIAIETHAKEEVRDITPQVNDAVRALGVAEGMVLLFCPHTTAALTVNEAADPDVRVDFCRAFSRMVPNIPFSHEEGNSPAHVRAALLGPSLLLPVEEGRLALGTWQGVYFCEFDGPRRRRVLVYGLVEGDLRQS